MVLKDEATKIIINTKGTVGNISNELKAVLMYMDGGVATNKYTKDLDKEVVSVKSDEKVRMQYMLLMEAYAEQRLLGRGKTIVQTIRRMVDKLSLEQMAFFMDVSVSECEEVIELIKEHPDWDDEQIAMEIDWDD